MNPLDDFLTLASDLRKEAADELKTKQQREIQLWQQWKDGGMQPQHLKPLMQSFKPLVAHRANIWAGKVRDVPASAIRAEFNNQFVQALQTYDPNRGTALGTHITHTLKKAQRFVTTYQNPARIPENRIYRIQELKDATQRLDEEFGRPPTQLEIADHLKWSPRQVEFLQKEVRVSRPTGQFEHDPMTFTPSRQQEVLRLLPYELTSEEKQVFEYLHGVGGKPRLEPGQIAQRLNMSAPKVSRLKKTIAEKYDKYTK